MIASRGAAEDLVRGRRVGAVFAILIPCPTGPAQRVRLAKGQTATGGNIARVRSGTGVETVPGGDIGTEAAVFGIIRR